MFAIVVKHCIIKTYTCMLGYLIIYLFLAVLGLRCWVQAFSSCSQCELLFIAVYELLVAVSSLV